MSNYAVVDVTTLIHYRIGHDDRVGYYILRIDHGIGAKNAEV